MEETKNAAYKIGGVKVKAHTLAMRARCYAATTFTVYKFDELLLFLLSFFHLIALVWRFIDTVVSASRRRRCCHGIILICFHNFPFHLCTFSHLVHVWDTRYNDCFGVFVSGCGFCFVHNAYSPVLYSIFDFGIVCDHDHVTIQVNAVTYVPAASAQPSNHKHWRTLTTSATAAA